MVDPKPGQKKVRITYEAYGHLIQKLTQQIVTSKNQFCGVYGPPRGGLPMAVHLAHHLKIPLLKKPETNCLVVDDIAGTGATLKKINQEVQGKITTATIHSHPESEIKPDYCVKAIEKEIWIVYPWEKE